MANAQDQVVCRKEEMQSGLYEQMLTCRILGGRSFSTASFVRRRMKGITCIMADNYF